MFKINFINFEQWIPISSVTNPPTSQEWLEFGYHDGAWFGENGSCGLLQITNYKGFFMAYQLRDVFYCRKISPSYSPGNKYTLSIRESYSKTTTINWTNLWYLNP